MTAIIQVQDVMCKTCIYRKGFGWDIAHLEAQIHDKYVGFRTFRACHHAKNGVCCRGFWNRHKDKFQIGQIAQRLDAVEFVKVDELGAR